MSNRPFLWADSLTTPSFQSLFSPTKTCSRRHHSQGGLSEEPEEPGEPGEEEEPEEGEEPEEPGEPKEEEEPKEPGEPKEVVFPLSFQ